tara:strand:- start:45 stop:422 length:378 start_codon:yes stop_codon:yes gene_type:complete
MGNPINESGKFGEDRFEEFLIYHDIPYKRNKTNGIDFIVWPTDASTYIDIKNQDVGGGRDLAVGGCVWKYQRKYNFKECYIVEGEFDFDKNVREFANLFAKTHFVKFEEMKNILLKKPTKIERFF